MYRYKINMVDTNIVFSKKETMDKQMYLFIYDPYSDLAVFGIVSKMWSRFRYVIVKNYQIKVFWCQWNKIV